MSVSGPKDTRSGAHVRRQVQLPFSKAVEIAFKSIKIRFWRSIITAAGIFLGIAFFTSVRMSGEFTTIQRHVIEQKKAAIAAGTLRPTAEDIRQVNSLEANAAEERSAAMRLRWLSIMSVTERYKEIGTMKCLGALDSLVVKLFFIEACFLGFVASALGFVLGWAVISVIRVFTDGTEVFGGPYWVATLNLLGVSVAIGTVLTFVATILPAMRAAEMPPAAALRVEI